MKRIVLILLLAWLPLTGQAAAKRTLDATVPAQNVSRITIHAGVGQLKVVPATDDKLHIQVGLEQKSRNFLWFFHWISDTDARYIEQISLQQQLQDGVISYSLKYPDHLDESDVKQLWEIQVPARLAVKVDMKVGQLDVSGVTGGVDVTLNVGEVTLNTPSGPMQAKVNVGQIRATSNTTQPGNIRLNTSIGDARLYDKAGSSHESHHQNGLGRTVTVAAQGADKMDLELNIGEVSLHIEPAAVGDKQP